MSMNQSNTRISSNLSSCSTGSRSQSSTSTHQTTNATSTQTKIKKKSVLPTRTQHFAKSHILQSNSPLIPLRGNLRRIHNQNGPSSTTFLYSLTIQNAAGTSSSSQDTKRTFELFFSRTHYEHIHRLFYIMDTESRGLLRRSQVSEFVAKRCPVFRRRDCAIQSSFMTDTTDKNDGSSGKVSATSVKNTANVAINNMAAKMSLSGSTEKPKMPNMPNFGNLISFPGVPNLHRNRKKHDSSSVSSSNTGNISSQPRWNCTFDEVWNAVVSTSLPSNNLNENVEAELSIEGWMLFCRFIALAQYQEAKSRFSAKHLQPNSEIIMVELPPPTPPSSLNIQALLQRERGAANLVNQNNDQLPVITSLPLPELDLNHCLIAAHDNPYTTSQSSTPHSLSLKSPPTTTISVSLFGVPNASEKSKASSISSSPESSDSFLHSGDMEFVVTSIETHIHPSTRVKVKRTMQDMEWLRETFAAHQRLGGTLCGRILPPFPTQDRRTRVSVAMNSLRTLANWGKPKDKKWESSEGIKKAKELERCLNYFMEHPALRTSFPLNAILRASQSGLDAAKRILDNDEAANTPSTNSTTNSPSSASTSSLNHAKFDLSTFFSSLSEPENPNLAWIRTAAQAAMALKVHGILDATGCASASAKLQHASLPSFDTSKWWRGDYNTDNSSNSKGNDDNEQNDETKESKNQCFENGVVSIESELDSDESYDLLPSPEQPILSSESTHPETNDVNNSPEKKFHYGKDNPTTIDTDILKLYEMINALENTLSRCTISSGSIADARKDRNSLHLSIVKGLDLWEGLKGEIVGERALMEGVVGLEGVRTVVEDGDWNLRDSLSWQSSLAGSAVSAAETVRSAVRAARTALSAKTAAESAALAAQKHCNSKFATPEEARTAQTRASISHSHAIHAAVVEHEAFGAKRRAAMALAHDVNCWNDHRKREMLDMLKKCARTQKEAARASRHAWVGLREGMYGVTSYAERMNEQNGELLLSRQDTINKNKDLDQFIVPVEHKCLGHSSVLGSIRSSRLPLENNINSEERPLSPLGIPFPNIATTKKDSLSPLSGRSEVSEGSEKLSSSEITEENDVMTASMQSLVDGLMTWGGRYDPQDDMSLPSGMAVSVALEESGVLNSRETSGKIDVEKQKEEIGTPLQ